MKKLTETAVDIARSNGKIGALTGQQTVQDALNANNTASGSNPFATLADVDGTGANITPATIVTTGSITSGTTVTATTGVITDSITEKTAGKGITLLKNTVQKRTLAALNSTGIVTAAMVNNGGITSTSAAGVTATLDAIATIVTQTGATAGTSVDFVIDNTGGASTVTLAVSAGIVVAKQTSSGDSAVDQLLTVAASSTIGVGVFRLYFQSTSAAVLFRVC